MSRELSPDPQRSLWFDLMVDSAQELPRDASLIHALITVSARRSRGGAAATSAAMVMIMDCSSSMLRQGKLAHARRAVEAAIDVLADGTEFAVIAGNHEARPLYPGKGGLARVSTRARAEAKVAVANLPASGGTAISTWLALADRLLGQAPDAIRHAVLYTDGLNEHENPRSLRSALRACADHFTCDARGVGLDWNPAVVRQIAEALQGQAEAIIDVADLREDFLRLMEHAQRMLVARICLRFTVDARFRFASVRQIRPTDNDLTGHQKAQDGGVVDIPLLGWGEEARDYLVTLEAADPRALPYEEVRAALIDVVAGDPAAQPAMHCADPAALTVTRQPYPHGPAAGRQPESVTQALDLERLTAAQDAGIAAWQRGDRQAALREFTEAVAIARRHGATANLARLRRLVAIDEYGNVSLQPSIDTADLLIASTRTTHHGDVPPPYRASRPAQPRGEQTPEGQAPGEQARGEQAPAPPAQRPPGQDLETRTCPRGHATTAPVVRFCEENGCGHQFSDPGGDLSPGHPPA